MNLAKRVNACLFAWYSWAREAASNTLTRFDVDKFIGFIFFRKVLINFYVVWSFRVCLAFRIFSNWKNILRSEVDKQMYRCYVKTRRDNEIEKLQKEICANIGMLWLFLLEKIHAIPLFQFEKQKNYKLMCSICIFILYWVFAKGTDKNFLLIGIGLLATFYSLSLSVFFWKIKKIWVLLFGII